MAGSVRRTKLMPGLTKCPTCKHIFDSKDMVECVKEGNKKGKVVCFDCGYRWLYSHAKTPSNLKGPAQSVGQQQMRME